MRYSLAVAALATVLSVRAEDHIVKVGDAGTLTFSPSNIIAAQNDNVIFQFMSKNHTVTQSTFAKPCEIQTTPQEGINSGFQFVDPAQDTIPQWSFTVDNATAPLWFFCAQTNPISHCGKGMVFSVNAKAGTEKSFEAYQALAISQNGGAAAGGGSSASGGSNSASGFVTQTNTGSGSSATGSPGGGAASGGAAGGPPGNTLTNADPSATSSGSAADASQSGAAVPRFGAHTASVLAVVGLVAGLTL